MFLVFRATSADLVWHACTGADVDVERVVEAVTATGGTPLLTDTTGPGGAAGERPPSGSIRVLAEPFDTATFGRAVRATLDTPR